MRIYIGNVKCKAEFGGRDNILNLRTNLREYLRVRPLGYNRVPSYQKRQWDGYRYFITNSDWFATGFLPIVISFAKDLGADVELVDERKNIPEYGNELFSITLPTGKTWDLRPEQLESIRSVRTRTCEGLPFRRGIMDVATNGGKTYLMAFIHASLKKPKTLVLIHNQLLFRQHVAFFSQIFDVSEVKSNKIEFGNFTIAMVKTLYNRAKESTNVKKELKTFNNIMVDEAHRASGKEYASLLQMMDAGSVVFFSGTTLKSKDKVKKLTLIGLSGTELYTISKRELMDMGRSQEAYVTILHNPMRSLSSSLTYQMEKENAIFFNPFRADLMKQVCFEHQDEQILIAVREIDHGEYILERLMENFEEGEVEFVHGEDEHRDLKVESFKQGLTRVLITTTILQEGINIENIRVLIIAAGGMDEIFLSQFSGRGERTDGENSMFHLYDFFDGGAWVAKHSRKRIKFYTNEKFNVKFDYLCTAMGNPK